MTTLDVPDSPKMLRETLAIAQTRILLSVVDGHEKHFWRLQRLIDECDRHRPLGADGRHGEDQHTPMCGCEDKPEMPTVGVGSFSDQAEAENWLAEQDRDDELYVPLEAEAATKMAEGIAREIDPSQVRPGDHVEVTYTGWVDDNGWIRSHQTEACLLSPPRFDKSGSLSVRVLPREERGE